MFIDSAEIYVKAGKGGDGAVSFLREKYKPKGGPDGGDGGDGGDIIVRVDNHCRGLSQYNRQKQFKAQNGANGTGRNKFGKRGEDITLLVPTGTQIYHDNVLLYDLVVEGETFILAHGGNGGWGNQHFATSIKQAPRWSKQGLKGEAMKVRFDLKLIADVGLVGLPNAGKSQLLSVVSNAKPKIADYAFTTLEPNLGIIKRIDGNIIVADIPGLIEGASNGRGLGDKFLKHIERTKIIVHVLDITSDDVQSDYKTVREELNAFSSHLEKKKEIIVLNKIDLLSQQDLEAKLATLKFKTKPILISAATNKNIESLIEAIKKKI